MTKFTPQLKSSKCNLNIPRLETLSMLRVICLSLFFVDVYKTRGSILNGFSKPVLLELVENKYKPNLNSFSYFLIPNYCEAAKTVLSITKKATTSGSRYNSDVFTLWLFFAQNIELLRIGHWWLKHFLLLFYFFYLFTVRIISKGWKYKKTIGWCLRIKTNNNIIFFVSIELSFFSLVR